MTQTEKRIEMVRLLQASRKGDEAPGDTVLRALRLLRASDEAADSAWSAVRAAVLDWFTLPPKYRTKKRLLEMVRLPSPEEPSN